MNKVSLKEFDKAINELPKTNDIVSVFGSVSVKELRKAVERFEYVPSFNDLLEENNRLNNITNELEKWLVESIEKHTEDYLDWKYDKNVYLAGSEKLQNVFDKLQELKGKNND